jgi:hypothetical protein
MVRILSVLPGNTAVVSTDRLYRVVTGRSKEVIAELVDMQQATIIVDALRRSGQLAEAIPYGAAAVKERDAEWGLHYDANEPDVLAILPRCVVVSTVGQYRVVCKRTGIVMHEFCDMDSAESLARQKGMTAYTDDDGKPLELEARSYDAFVEPAAMPLTVVSDIESAVAQSA